MTEGKISRSILLFALPIFLGDLFQQLYNVVDSLVVGNVLGKEALAAVSSTGSLLFLIVGFLHGVFVGSSVIISRSFGAKDAEKVSIAVHTTIASALIAGILITALGIGMTPLLLKWMGTPDDVFTEAVTYLRLYLAGGIFMVMYNACMGIFQAVGDSKRPLYYLIIAAVLNVVLDLLFVAVFGWGIGGVAVATVISQMVSATLGLIKLTKVDGIHKVDIKKIRIDFGMLKVQLKLGLPTGVQNSVVAFANVIVQSNINVFGSVAMAGNGAYAKLERFAFLPITSFSIALTTFVGQNLGAKKYDRAKKGARFGLVAGVLMAQIIGILIWSFAPTLVGIFNSDPQVIFHGTQRAKVICLFYFLLALSHCLSGVLRGAGKTTVPMFVMLISWCFIRIAYIMLMVKIIPDIRVIYWAYPLTWFISTAVFFVYYRKTDFLGEPGHVPELGEAAHS